MLRTNKFYSYLVLAIFQELLYRKIPKVANEIIMIGGGRQGGGIVKQLLTKPLHLCNFWRQIMIMTVNKFRDMVEYRKERVFCTGANGLMRL
jgi:hypothetical protein